MGWGEYIQGWRVVFKGLAVSTKTLCSAPCLLNSAKLIWSCFFHLLGVTISLPPFLSLFHFGLRDSASRSRTLPTGHMLSDAHASQRKKCSPLSREFICQTTWQKPAVSAQRSPSNCPFILSRLHLCARCGIPVTSPCHWICLNHKVKIHLGATRRVFPFAFTHRNDSRVCYSNENKSCVM